MEKALAPVFAGRPRDVTEENLQARARGTILMAISNKFGLMVVTTGNKSEMSVGYATLYGDMNGGFNPVKDLYKTEVYRLARLRNGWKPDGALGAGGRVIPENIITRAPTAELRENQTDQDSLPPYDVLDAILERLVEREEPIASIVAEGFDRETVMKVERMLDLAEYKRRQAAPGVKVTLKNFGRDRRYPIVNRFRDSGAPLPEPDRSLLKDGAARPRARRTISEVLICVGCAKAPTAPCPRALNSMNYPRGHAVQAHRFAHPTTLRRCNRWFAPLTNSKSSATRGRRSRSWPAPPPPSAPRRSRRAPCRAR